MISLMKEKILNKTVESYIARFDWTLASGKWLIIDQCDFLNLFMGKSSFLKINLSGKIA